VGQLLEKAKRRHVVVARKLTDKQEADWVADRIREATRHGSP
jgi:hypothetical protein